MNESVPLTDLDSGFLYYVLFPHISFSSFHVLYISYHSLFLAIFKCSLVFLWIVVSSCKEFVGPSGLARVKLTDGTKVQVYCEMVGGMPICAHFAVFYHHKTINRSQSSSLLTVQTLFGGGWTVIGREISSPSAENFLWNRYGDVRWKFSF